MKSLLWLLDLAYEWRVTPLILSDDPMPSKIKGGIADTDTFLFRKGKLIHVINHIIHGYITLAYEWITKIIHFLFCGYIGLYQCDKTAVFIKDAGNSCQNWSLDGHESLSHSQ